MSLSGSFLIDAGNFDGVLDGGSFLEDQPIYETPTAGFKDFSFNFSVILNPKAENPSVSNFDFYDRSFLKETSATIKDNRFFQINIIDNVKPEDFTINLSNTGVASIRQWGEITQLSDGVTTLIGSSDSYEATYPLTLQQFGGSVYTFQEYGVNSLSRHINDKMTELYSGKVFAYSAGVYRHYTPPVFERNPDCIFKDIDISFLPDWNSRRNAAEWCGVLITPRHLLSCTHTTALFSGAGGLAVGDTITFTSMSNVTQIKTISRTTGVVDTAPYYPDISVLELDSDVSGDINFIKLMPSGSEFYLPTNFLNAYYSLGSTGYSTIYNNSMNKQRICNVKRPIGSFNQSTLGNAASYHPFAPKPIPTDFFIETYINDSSTPTFFIINNEPVLVSLITFFGGAGTNISRHIPVVNGLLSGLGTAYRVTEADLSSFTLYPGFVSSL